MEFNNTIKTARKLLALMLGMAMLTTLSACGQEQEQGPDYADDEAMSIIAKGYEKRSDKIDSMEEQKKDTGSTSNLKEIVQTELDVDKELKNRDFKDSKLQEQVVAYINTLQDSVDLLEKSSTDSDGFNEQWSEIRDERSTILKVFVDKYKLTVGDKYKDDFNDLVANGAAVAEDNAKDEAINGLISGVTFKKKDEGYGSFTYTADIANTTQYTFTDVSLILALYDDKGVKADETYATTKSWAPGETVRFEAYGQVNTSKIKVSVENYDTED